MNVRFLGPSGSVNTSASVDESLLVACELPSLGG